VKIPESVEVSADGNTITQEEIKSLLKYLKPDADDAEVFVEVFNLNKIQEGRLFNELNMEEKKPSNAVSIDMFPDKSADRRFVSKLMSSCGIFGSDEMKRHFNAIAEKSRKLTTNVTLTSAIKPYSRELLKLERDYSVYADLISFFCECYKEWSNHFPVFKPMASGDDRQDLRENSFAASNIMFFPMFRLAWELCNKYRK